VYRNFKRPFSLTRKVTAGLVSYQSTRVFCLESADFPGHSLARGADLWAFWRGRARVRVKGLSAQGSEPDEKGGRKELCHPTDDIGDCRPLATLIPPPGSAPSLLSWGPGPHRFAGSKTGQRQLVLKVRTHGGGPQLPATCGGDRPGGPPDGGIRAGSSRPAPAARPSRNREIPLAVNLICGRCCSPACMKSSRCGAPAVGSRCD